MSTDKQDDVMTAIAVAAVSAAVTVLLLAAYLLGVWTA